VVKEMEWVIASFGHVEEVWKARALKVGDQKAGHKAYARREADRWKRWKETAKAEFAKVTKVNTFPM